jgi:hypothetical protein
MSGTVSYRRQWNWMHSLCLHEREKGEERKKHETNTRKGEERAI